LQKLVFSEPYSDCECNFGPFLPNRTKWLFCHLKKYPNDLKNLFIKIADSAYFCPMHFMTPFSDTKYKTDSDTMTLTEETCVLIVWNDEVNTFEWVIETLVAICGHSSEQAEQCAIIIDSKGKYAVKEGNYDILKPMCDAITDRGINATIEVTAQ
jgi:ATP-dependent Clp protease adaptor protein ClpS